MVGGMKSAFLLAVLLVCLGGCGDTPPVVVDEPAAEPSGPALAVLRSSELAVVGPDGAVRGRYSFGDAVSPVDRYTYLGGARGGRLSAIAFYEGPGLHSAQTRVLVDRAGRPVWEESVSGRCEPWS